MQTKTQTHLVTVVRDGDSFGTQRGTEVRLANVNAPEKGKPGYLSAKRKLESLILRKYVEVNPVATGPYGRVVAQVYVGRIHVNEEMRRFLRNR